MIIETSIGYTDEDGFYIGYNPEFAFMNCFRRKDLQKPILIKGVKMVVSLEEARNWAKEAEKKRLANPTKCNKPEHKGVCYD